MKSVTFRFAVTHMGTRSGWRCAVFFALAAAGWPARAEVGNDSGYRVLDLAQVTVEAQGARLGPGPDAAFAYVRDHIRYEAYQGSLRGARGALLSEAGNAVDQTLLLQRFLSAAGERCQIVEGTLSLPKAARLVDAMLRSHPATPRAAPPDASAMAFFAAIRNQVRGQYELIRDTLVRGGFKIPKSAGVSPRELRQLVRDHTWLQCRRAGAWVDLDPSFPTSRVGEAHATARPIGENLPDGRHHRLVLRLLLEEKGGGSRRTRVLLEHRTRAAELFGRAVVLTHQPAEWSGPKPLSDLAAGVGEALGSLAGGPDQIEIKPVLLVNNQHLVGETFAIQPPEGKATSLLSAFGGGASKITAIAEWLEIEILTPDGGSERTRRLLFDRVGFAARGAGQTSASGEPLHHRHPLRGLFCLTTYTGPLRNPRLFASGVAAHSREEKATSNESVSVADSALALASLNHTVSLLSDGAVSGIRLDDEPVLFATTSPRVIISSLSLGSDFSTLAIDLRRSKIQPFTRSVAAARKAFELRVLRGVVEGVVEAAVADFVLEVTRSLPNGLKPAAYSAVRIFETASAAGVKPTLLAGVSSPLPGHLAANPRARVRADVKAGQILVIPEKQVELAGTARTAWWRIDRATGSTVAVTEDGLHQGTFYVVLNRTRDITAVWVHQTGSAVVMAYTGAAARLGMFALELTVRGYTRVDVTPFLN